MQIEIKLLDPRAKIPVRATQGSAAVDLVAVLDDPLKLYPGEVWKVHTGIAMQIPPGYVGLIAPRSGLSTKHGIKLANQIGVLDSDYRDEVLVALKNDGPELYTVNDGDRIAQMMIVPVMQPAFVAVDDLDETDRKGGFGSTGAGLCIGDVLTDDCGRIL